MGFIRDDVGNVTIEERRESFVLHYGESPHAEYLYRDLADIMEALALMGDDDRGRYAAWIRARLPWQIRGVD